MNGARGQGPLAPGVRALLLLLPLLAAAAATAQAPPQPAAAPAPAAAPPDTAQIAIAVPAGAPPVLAIHVRPDSVRFGGLLEVGLVFAGPAPADSLVTAPATLLGDPGPGRGVADAWPPASPGQGALTRSWRVYRAGPLVLRCAEATSQVVTVASSLQPGAEPAPVRPPRPLGLLLAAWVWFLSAAAVLALALWWLWRRRRVVLAGADRPLAPIAWFATVQDLRRLLQDAGPDKAGPRAFLDRLAGMVRAYVQGRYLIGAREMTGPEMVQACRARGYDLAAVRDLARLIDGLDGRRYDAVAPTANDCRAATARFVQILEQGRQEPLFTPVAADLVAGGRAAWDALRRDFPGQAAQAMPGTPPAGRT